MLKKLSGRKWDYYFHLPIWISSKYLFSTHYMQDFGSCPKDEYLFYLGVENTYFME